MVQLSPSSMEYWADLTEYVNFTFQLHHATPFTMLLSSLVMMPFPLLSDFVYSLFSSAFILFFSLLPHFCRAFYFPLACLFRNASSCTSSHLKSVYPSHPDLIVSHQILPAVRIRYLLFIYVIVIVSFRIYFIRSHHDSLLPPHIHYPIINLSFWMLALTNGLLYRLID